MSAPIDRIENVRASVDDVERQMQLTQSAGVMIPPSLAWRLLSECRSLLGPTLSEERAKAWEEGRIAGLGSSGGRRAGSPVNPYQNGEQS